MVVRTRSTTIVLALLLPAAASLGADAGPPFPLSGEWSRDATWDDGLAEVAVYEASRVIYGAPRLYDAVLLTVKEDFDAHRLVKADPPHDDRSIVTVIKQNAVREIATPNYDYRIMTSTFVERNAPTRLVKLTSGSQEWCGNTWKEVRNREGRVTYDWSSYWDGEGAGLQEIELGDDTLFADQLPLVLRGLEFRPGLKFSARLVPGMGHNHAGPLRRPDVEFEVVGKETTVVPAGEIDTWRVRMTAGEISTQWWFDVGGTHPLVRMESSTGDRLALKKIERRTYW